MTKDLHYIASAKNFIVNGISFTARELDVMACLLNGRNTKSTASFLSSINKEINERSVQTHIANIRRKINAPSRAEIINFLEKHPNQYKIVRQHYIMLKLKINLNQAIKTHQTKSPQDFPQKLLVIIDKQDEKAKITADLLIMLLSSNFIKKDLIILDKETNILDIDLHSYDVITLISNLAKNTDQVQKLNHYNGNIILCHNHDLGKLERNITYVKFSDDLKNIDIVLQIAAKIFNNPSLVDLESETYELKENKISSILNYKISILKFPILMGLILLAFVSYVYNDKLEKVQTVSKIDLSISDLTLERPKLLQELEEKLNKQSYNKSIAIIGISGSGKNILTTTYAKKTGINIIAEIDSSSLETIKTSFERLAFSLANSEEEKKQFRELLIINDEEDSASLVLKYVKKKLSYSKEWLLIYNNATQEQFLHKYYPIDSESWGKGTLIITTQDGNFAKSCIVKDSLLMPDLSLDEKRDLFVKITEKTGAKLQDKLAADYFLKNIPPYPLDVQIAANYFIFTKFGGDVDAINKANFDKELHEEIALENFGVQTRNNLVDITLDKIIQKDQNLLNILFFISVIGNNNIPKELIEAYPSPINYNYFHYQVNKYSIFQIKFDNEYYTINTNFALHNLIREYCFKKIPKDKLSEHFSKMLNSFRDVEKSIAGVSQTKIRNMIYHSRQILKYKDYMNKTTYAGFLLRLGNLYLHTHDYLKAERYLLSSLYELEKLKIHSEELYLLKTNLGKVYEALGNYDKSYDLLKESLQWQQKNKTKDASLLLLTKSFLAQVELELGRYTISEKILKEVLDRSSGIDNYPLVKARSLTFYCILKKIFGEYEEAEQLCDYALEIYKKDFPEDKIYSSFAEFQKASIAVMRKDFANALTRLEKIQALYTKLYPSRHPIFSFLNMGMMNLYFNSKDFEKAEKYSQEAYKNILKNYGKNDLRIAYIFNVKAEIAISNKNFNEAEHYVNEAEKILSHYKHPGYHYTLLNKALILKEKRDKYLLNDDIKNVRKITAKLQDSINLAREIILKTYPDLEKRKNLLDQLKTIEKQSQYE